FQDASLAGLVVMLVLLIAVRHDLAFEFAERIACRLERSMPRLKTVSLALREAIEQWRVSIRNMHRVACGVILGALIHVGHALVMMVIVRGVGIGLSFFDLCWVLGVMSVASLVPITIGPVAAQGTLVALLQFLSVPLTDALAVSALVMAVNL